MATNAKHIIPAMATHPGSVLKKELRSRGIKQKDFATIIGMPAPNLSELINGKRNITQSIALRLEEALNIPFQNWMNLQNRYYYVKTHQGAPSMATAKISDEISREVFSGDILVKARKEVGMTQSELAEKIGKDKSFISKIERGLSIPTLDMFYRIVSAMGLSVKII